MKCLFALLLVVSLLPASAQLTYETLYVDYDSAWQYKNLKIVPIRMKGGGGNGADAGLTDVVSLSQAINQGLVTVTERGTTSFDNVHFLRFNTHSDKSVYISGGEIIAGGRQDRMIIRDTILHPSTKDQYVPVMCVEEGRWSEKEKKFGYGNFANADLRKVLDSTKNQVSVWREVDRQLQAGAFKNKTESYLSRNEDKKYILVDNDYMNFFRQKFQHSDSTIVGFVAISGDKIIGSDIFAGRNLFYHLLDPLLHGYIDGAITSGAPPAVSDKVLRRYMDKLLKTEESQEEFVRTNGKIFRENGRVIHVNTFLKSQGE